MSNSKRPFSIHGDTVQARPEDLNPDLGLNNGEEESGDTNSSLSSQAKSKPAPASSRTHQGQR